MIREPVKRDTPFDQWIYQSYMIPYNVQFQYWLDDGEMDPTYNLIPAKAQQCREIGMILKYMFFEAYDEVSGSVHFMRANSPRLICLIGSKGIDPETGGGILGSAEGGTKMLLYDLNNLDVTSIESVNTGYLHTMHHEFGHILHQKKSYPQEEFNTISAGFYANTNWASLKEQEAWDRGFVTRYACSEPREDFVEVLSIYVTSTDEWWNNMMRKASDFGRTAIAKKLSLVTIWLQDQWGIDILELQASVRRRGEELPQRLAEINF